jgi:hypothetical protein
MNKVKKKKQLLEKLPDMMRGSIALTSRSCGKTNCKKCQSGGKHPVCLFAFQIDGKKKVTSIPAEFQKRVRELIDNWHHHKDLIETVTNMNVELVKEGLLEE